MEKKPATTQLEHTPASHDVITKIIAEIYVHRNEFMLL
jgi:hypothetical protein